MKMKKIFSFIIIFVIFFEITSLIATKFNLLTFNYEPKYSLQNNNKLDWIESGNKGFPSHKKNYKTKHISRCFDVKYNFNNVGAKDIDDYFTNDQKKSIVLIGDSFAEGFGVGNDKIFSKIIEKKIKKKILNFGIAGSDPNHQLYNYTNNWSKYNFDELIYFFLPNNDFLQTIKKEENYINNQVNKSFFKDTIDKTKKKLHFFIRNKVPNFLANFTYSYNSIRSFVHIFNLQTIDYDKDASYFYQNRSSIDFTFDKVKKLINYKKIKTYIVIIPTTSDIISLKRKKTDYKNLYWYSEIKKIAENSNSILIDLMDHIDFEKKHVYYHSCDGHWSEYGNKYVANIFLKYYFNN